MYHIRVLKAREMVRSYVLRRNMYSSERYLSIYIIMKRNYINKDYGYDKFIIFLKHSYFKRSCLTPFKNKLINELELRGICIKPFFSSNFTRNISRCNLCQSRLRGMYRNHIDMKQTGFTWDDNTIPEVNVLYIWLTDNK